MSQSDDSDGHVITWDLNTGRRAIPAHALWLIRLPVYYLYQPPPQGL